MQPEDRRPACHGRQASRLLVGNMECCAKQAGGPLALTGGTPVFRLLRPEEREQVRHFLLLLRRRGIHERERLPDHVPACGGERAIVGSAPASGENGRAGVWHGAEEPGRPRPVIPQGAGAPPPRRGGTISRCRGIIPRRGGTIPRRGGTIPRRGGTIPRRGGAIPRRGGTIPRRGGAIPRRGGAIPPRP